MFGQHRRATVQKRCHWYAGSTKRGYEVACLISREDSTTYQKPSGTPSSWRFAFGPYSTKAKAVQVAMYQSHGTRPRIRR